jgi:DNA (cytosine-5)-methyltransferase 3A
MEEKKHNTLSVFNGMGCIWIAMELAGHQVGKRYSSEIEKYPNQMNDSLYPDTIQLGDVRNLDVSKLDPIDVFAGGSPCQSFSFAGKRKGMSTKCELEILTLDHYLQLKKENFQFEGQSYLFWEYVRILTDIKKYNPDVKFLLENVLMGKKWRKVITQAIGVNPIRINASLVSGQTRDRLFWTNIYCEQDGFFGDLKCIIPQPKDEGILLKDNLEDNVDKKYLLSEKAIKSIILNDQNLQKSFVNPLKSSTICSPGNACGVYKGATYVTQDIQKQNLVQIGNLYDNKHNSVAGRIYTDKGKSVCLSALGGGGGAKTGLYLIENKIRRLTPRECGRLQSVPEEKLDVILNCGVSDTQLYKAFGNGWNCKVISHILNYLNK